MDQVTDREKNRVVTSEPLPLFEFSLFPKPGTLLLTLLLMPISFLNLHIACCNSPFRHTSDVLSLYSGEHLHFLIQFPGFYSY